MRFTGLQGVARGKKVITTNPDTAQPCPDDKVNGAFAAVMPNRLRVSNFTCVSSWQGMAHVAFATGPRTMARALAKSIIGLFKTEVIKFLGPWKSVAQVEWETLNRRSA